MKKIFLLSIALLLGGCAPIDRGADSQSASSSITELKWKHFHNEKMGFSIDYPSQIFDSSAQKAVSTSMLEKENGAFMTIDGQPRNYAWNIKIFSIPYSEVERHLQEKFGKGCKAEFLPSKQTDEAVIFLSDPKAGEGLDETNCPLNFPLTIKFHRKKSILAYWDFNPEFINDGSGTKYIEKMNSSFAFDK